MAYSATNGTMNPTNDTIIAGTDSSQFTSTSNDSAFASIAVDNEIVNIPITVNAPSFSIDDVSHHEGDPDPPGVKAYTFTVTKTGATSLTTSVDCETADDSAIAPSDYTAITTTTLNFGPADTSMQFTVFVNGDNTFEPDERFFVNLTNPVGATISDAQGIGEIMNDDPALPGISIDDVTSHEPSGGTVTATFTVTLSTPAANNVTVDYFTQDGSATASADYEAIAPQQLVFIPGQVTQTVNVTINADALAEDNENFFVQLSNVSDNATLDDDTGEGTILDAVLPGQLLISEFRFRGPTFSAQQNIDGFRDEYVELYNTKNFPMTVAATDGSNGWTIASLNSSGTSADVLVVIPNGAVIPAHGHFLAVNSDAGVILKPNQGITPDGGYSLDGIAVGDAFYVTDISDNSGVAVFTTSIATSFNPDTRLDAAGFAGLSGETADLFREGAGLTSPGAVDGQYAFVRHMESGVPQDTDNNAADFSFVATDGDAYGGLQSMLGAPVWRIAVAIRATCLQTRVRGSATLTSRRPSLNRRRLRPRRPTASVTVRRTVAVDRTAPLGARAAASLPQQHGRLRHTSALPHCRCDDAEYTKPGWRSS